MTPRSSSPATEASSSYSATSEITSTVQDLCGSSAFPKDEECQKCLEISSLMDSKETSWTLAGNIAEVLTMKFFEEQRIYIVPTCRNSPKNQGSRLFLRFCIHCVHIRYENLISMLHGRLIVIRKSVMEVDDS
eukprot:gene5633-10849_t